MVNMPNIMALSVSLIMSVFTIICFFRIKDLKIYKLKPIIIYLTIIVLNISLSIFAYKELSYLPYFISSLILINLLLIIAVIDYKTKSIPDCFLLIMLVMGLVTIFFIPQVEFYNPLITAVFLGLIMFLINKKSKNALGMGDVKLLGILALFFGFQKVIEIIFLSLVMGLIFGLFVMIKNKQNLKTELPFIPFVFLSVLISLLT